jgi:hypothetical protein
MDLHSRPRQREQDHWTPREQAAGPAPLQQVGVQRGGQLPRGRSYSALTFSKKPNCLEGGKRAETRSESSVGTGVGRAGQAGRGVGIRGGGEGNAHAAELSREHRALEV